jgi:hypothetical protein
MVCCCRIACPHVDLVFLFLPNPTKDKFIALFPAYFSKFPRKDGEPDKSAYVMNRVPTEKMELQRQHNFSSDATFKQALDSIGDVGPGQFKVDVGMEATIGDQAGQNTKIL